jgi:hypothetical protein
MGVVPSAKGKFMNVSSRYFEIIDSALKKIWRDDIISDYDNDFLFKEDTLKNSLYYHLRNELGDGFLKHNLLRVYTEYDLGVDDNGMRQIADIAIVKMLPLSEMEDGYSLWDRVDEVVTIIELKYKRFEGEAFYDDVYKMKSYIKSGKLDSCQFYLGFVCEDEYINSEASWLHNSQSRNWAKDRLTELTAHYDSETGEFVSNIVSH